VNLRDYYPREIVFAERHAEDELQRAAALVTECSREEKRSLWMALSVYITISCFAFIWATSYVFIFWTCWCLLQQNIRLCPYLFV